MTKKRTKSATAPKYLKIPRNKFKTALISWLKRVGNEERGEPYTPYFLQKYGIIRFGSEIELLLTGKGSSELRMRAYYFTGLAAFAPQNPGDHETLRNLEANSEFMPYADMSAADKKAFVKRKSQAKSSNPKSKEPGIHSKRVEKKSSDVESEFDRIKQRLMFLQMMASLEAARFNRALLLLATAQSGDDLKVGRLDDADKDLIGEVRFPLTADIFKSHLARLNAAELADTDALLVLFAEMANELAHRGVLIASTDDHTYRNKIYAKLERNIDALLLALEAGKYETQAGMVEFAAMQIREMERGKEEVDDSDD